MLDTRLPRLWVCRLVLIMFLFIDLVVLKALSFWFCGVARMTCVLFRERCLGHRVDDLHVFPRLPVLSFVIPWLYWSLMMGLQGCSFSSMFGFSLWVFQHRGFNEARGISCPALIAADLSMWFHHMFSSLA